MERRVPPLQTGMGKLIAGAWLLSALATLFVGAPASAQTEPYEPPKQMTLSPTGVDLVSGHFTTKVVDLAIGPFTLERSYIGGHTVEGSDYFGPNWTHNYADYVSEGYYGKGDTTHVTIGRTAIHFTKLAAGGYFNSSLESAGTTLEEVGGAYVFTDRDGTVYTFSASVNAFPPLPGRRNQRVARIDYVDGHTLQYSYNSGGKLIQIASNRGYSLVFEYGANGFVSKACGYNRAVAYLSATPTCAGAPLVVSYAYANSGGIPNVTSVTDVASQTWGYDYNDNGNLSRLTCVRQVNSSTCLISNTYGTEFNGRVTQQTAADGGVWTYNYDVPDKSGDAGAPVYGTLTYASGSYSGPQGLSGGATFGAGLLNTYSESGRITTVTWDGVELHSLAYPEGNKVEYFRDYRQNVLGETWSPKPGSGLSPISRSTTFPYDCATVAKSVCNKPLSKTDYKGNQTDYTYDSAHGGVLTETGPADANGIRPVKRYGYVQRYAWIKASGGGYAQATAPIWLLASEKICRTSATVSGACSAGTADEVTTTYDFGLDAGPNTLLLRGKVVTADGVSLRTCYGYDDLGRKVRETSPRAGLTVCS